MTASPAILTSDQRVRVFISSALPELAAERAAARRAIRRLHLAPVWYESGARPHRPRSMYRAYLDQSQVFVGIYWQHSGWVAPRMGISGLEDEYAVARQAQETSVATYALLSAIPILVDDGRTDGARSRWLTAYQEAGPDGSAVTVTPAYEALDAAREQAQRMGPDDALRYAASDDN